MVKSCIAIDDFKGDDNNSLQFRFAIYNYEVVDEQICGRPEMYKTFAEYLGVNIQFIHSSDDVGGAVMDNGTADGFMALFETGIPISV